MQVKTFAAKLDMVSPALSKKEFVKVLCSFMFDKESVWAFNDIIGIRTKLDTGVTGAVNGNMLMRLVNSLNAAEAEVTDKKGTLEIKAGGSKLTLPILGDDQIFFRFEDEMYSDALGIPIRPILLKALDKVLISASDNPQHPERMGVTVAMQKSGNVRLSATDNKTICTAEVTDYEGISEDVTMIWPIAFCQSIVDIGSTGGEHTLYYHKENNHVVVDMEAQDCTIFSKLVMADPIDYETALDRFFGEFSSVFSIPEELPSVLKRAHIIGGDGSECAVTEIDDGIEFLTVNERDGQVKDKLPKDSGVVVPDGGVKIDVAHVLRGLNQGVYSDMGIAGRSTILAGEMEEQDGDSLKSVHITYFAYNAG